MFGSLIQRKQVLSLENDDIAFESTTFSLSTAVPRPSERRDEDRLPSSLCIIKLTTDDTEQLIRVRNMSAGGLMAEVGQIVSVGEAVWIEFNGQKIPASVIWTREGTAGFKFAHNIDLGELLAGRKPRHGFRARPPRLDVQCKASIRVGSTYYNCEVRDISLGGMKVEPIEEYCLGKDVVVVVESLRPIKGQVRWFSERRAGIVFNEPLTLEELADWVGKRVEMASLKASYKKNN
ncbi:MAG: PilZ domain-containing protein [Sphingomicrobium sp.]